MFQKRIILVKKLFSNKLINNIIIFTLSTVMNKGLNFFILPVLTYYLTKEDYGYLGFIMSIVTISTIYVGLWPGNFLISKYFVYGKEKIAKYMSNIFVILIVTFILYVLILFVFENILFIKFSDKSFVIFLISFYTLFMVCFNILNTIIQLEKNALKYALFQAFYAIFSLGIALVLIIHFHLGWKGKFLGEMSVLFLLSLYMIYYFIKNKYIVFDIDIKKLKELFFYLFPMTFHVVGIFLMVTIDKVILAHYLRIEDVGIYTIAMTMSMIVNIVYDSAMRGWEPYIFERLADESQKSKNWIYKTILIFSAFVIVSATVYIFVVPFIFDFMINEKFNESLKYIPYLVVAFSLEGIRKPLTSLLMHKNRVKTLGIISFLTALLNICLNIILIQKYGIFGAVYSTIISFFVLLILTLVNLFLDFSKANTFLNTTQ